MFRPEARDVAFAGGFLLTNRELAGVAHFERRRLPGGWSLWCDEAVSTGAASADSGDFVIVRGEVADLHNEAADAHGLATELLVLMGESLDDLHARLAWVGGRYVVMFRKDGRLSVCNDALGMRSVYYSTVETEVSSHFHLLSSELEVQSVLQTKAALITLDLTPNSVLRSLLPNYSLDVMSGDLHRFYPARRNAFTDEFAESRLDEIETLSHRYIDAYERSFGGLALSVTGGQDSRLMLALAKDHGARISGFTYGSPRKESLRRGGYWAESMQLDYDIVQKLLPHIGLRDHHFIDITPFSAGELSSPLSQSELAVIRSNTWAAHGQYLVGIYRELFSGGDWAHLRASGVEIGRRARTPQVDTYEAFLRKHSSPEVQRADVVEAGERLGYDNDMHGYARWDLAYWEIRMGKWHAEMMNEHDAAFSSFVPIGARRILDLFLSFTPEQRRAHYAVKELINRTAPLLNFFGTNDRRNLFEKMRDEGQDTDSRLAAEAAPVFASLTVFDPTGEVQHRRLAAAPSLYIGNAFFVQGARVCGEFFRTDVSGDLRVIIENAYEREQGVGSFEWRVLVDDVLVVHGDGARSANPVTVSLVGLRPEQRVSLELAALKTRSAPSWQAATATRIREIDFMPRLVGHSDARLAGCDSPFSVVSRDALP